ncbi:MAG: CPBP family intramembrane metalloprotease, partial [Bacteroidetes bacterium]|nr:CPBP family intramembrane metalloprotease [Bacteroidota bacterium]
FVNGSAKVRIIWRFLSFAGVFMGINMLLQWPLHELLDSSLMRGNLSSLIILISIFISLFVQVRYVDRTSFGKYGMAINGKWVNEFLVGCVLAFVQLSLFFLAMRFSGNLVIADKFVTSSPDYNFLQGFFSEIYRMLNVGFIEEIMFRSFLFFIAFEALRRTGKPVKWRVIAACLILSPLFGLAHASNNGATLFSTINISIDALTICLPFVITGRLGMSIGMHFAWNAVLGALYGFAVSGHTAKASILLSEMPDNIWTGGEFGPEGSVLLVAMDIIAVLLIVLWKKIKHYEHWVDPDFATRET